MSPMGRVKRASKNADTLFHHDWESKESIIDRTEI